MDPDLMEPKHLSELVSENIDRLTCIIYFAFSINLYSIYTYVDLARNEREKRKTLGKRLNRQKT